LSEDLLVGKLSSKTATFGVHKIFILENRGSENFELFSTHPGRNIICRKFGASVEKLLQLPVRLLFLTHDAPWWLQNVSLGWLYRRWRATRWLTSTSRTTSSRRWKASTRSRNSRCANAQSDAKC